MGCTVSNMKLDPKHRASNRYTTQIDLQQVYDEAIALCKQEEYAYAKEKFEIVQNNCPTFPYIDMNLNQCQKLIQVKQLYDEDYSMKKKLTWLQCASKKYNHFNQIIRMLERLYKVVETIILDQLVFIIIQCLAEQLKKMIDEFKKKLEERQKYLAELEQKNREQQKLIESYQQEQLKSKLIKGKQNISNSQAQDQRAPAPQIRNSYYKDKPQKTKLKPIEKEDTNGPLNKVPIYFVCLKDPKCKEWLGGSPFKHSKCGTTAFFHADGKISCQKTCATYNIKQALFSCKANTVCQSDSKSDKEGLEYIPDMARLADFVEDCLKEDNHAETDQMKFRELVVNETLLKLFL